MSRGHPSLRIGLVAALLVSVLLGLAAPALATGGSPLLTVPVERWSPLLDGGSDGSMAPLPPPGSAEDREDLDALVRLQSVAGEASAAQVAAWVGAAAVHRWNAELLQQIRDDRLNPLRAARVLALLNATIHDSVLTAATGAPSARPSPADRDPRVMVTDTVGVPPGATVVAIAGAAETILGHLFPSQAARYADVADEAVLAAQLAGSMTELEAQAARAVGRAVGRRAVERATSDGSDVTWEGELPTDPDLWRPLTSEGAPLEVSAGSWRTWVLRDGAELRPPPPPAVGSEAFLRDAAELQRIRDELTVEQMEFARFWADGMGTVTPAGHWMLIALELARDEGLDLEQTARMAGAVSVAQADAFIACWEAKYIYWYARPAQLIPGFVSAIQTPPFPAYPSGHSTQSSAAATVLSAFFPAHRERLEALAFDAAESRIVAGVHWRFDSEVGVELGAAVGQRVVDRLLGAG
jgi:hypothetical protein